MQHEVLSIVAVERVDDLLVLAGAQRDDDQRLGLATGEQGGTVAARQDADLAVDRPHRARVAAVDALARLENVAADDVLLDRLERPAGALGFTAFLGQHLHDPLLDRVDLLDPLLLDLFAIGLTQWLGRKLSRIRAANAAASSSSSAMVHGSLAASWASEIMASMTA